MGPAAGPPAAPSAALPVAADDANQGLIEVGIADTTGGRIGGWTTAT
jgi:hypothetical protein